MEMPGVISVTDQTPGDGRLGLWCKSKSKSKKILFIVGTL